MHANSCTASLETSNEAGSTFCLKIFVYLCISHQQAAYSLHELQCSTVLMFGKPFVIGQPAMEYAGTNKAQIIQASREIDLLD
jgi:hypothetical protein